MESHSSNSNGEFIHETTLLDVIIGENTKSKKVINPFANNNELWILKSYVDLDDFEREDWYNEYFDEAIQFTSSDDWKEHMFSLETLRRINKYEPSVIDQRIMEMHPFIDKWINSPRTTLNKHSLIFVQEIFMVPRSEDLIDFAMTITPLLQLKSGFEYSMVRGESKIAIQYISASAAYPKVIDALWIGCESPNFNTKGVSWQALTDAIFNMHIDHYITPENFTILFETLSKALITPKTIDGKTSKKILNHIGLNRVKNICDAIFQQEDSHKVKRIMSVFEIKSKKKATSGGFRNFMKKMKKAKPENDPNSIETGVNIIIN